MTLRRMWIRAWAALVAGMVGLALMSASSPAQADTSRGIEIPEFYDPPSSVPATPGTLIRHEPMEFALSLPVVFPGTSTRLMYSSIDSTGRPVAVSGAYIEPTVPWKGAGPRPVVGFAVGSIGQGDQCSPSLGLEQPIGWGMGEEGSTLTLNYDMTQMTLLLNSGVAVAVTDYVGLGTTGRTHTYVDRLDSGRALLDVVRAAKRLPETSLRADSKVGLWGYSQGGGAAASAAELQPSYAPDVALAGSYAGAPPADLRATLKGVDGNLISGMVGWALNGFAESDPSLRPVLDAQLNARGKAMLTDVSTACTGDVVFGHGLTPSTSWTVSGKSFGQVIDADPRLSAVIDAQRIGRSRPTSPVLVSTDLADGTVPHKQARQLAVDWCGKGSPVTYLPVGLPPLPLDQDKLAVHHLAGAVESAPIALPWLLDRLNGRSHRSNCSTIGWLP